MTNDQTTPQPSLYIPHGGGPCFFMPDPRGIWREMENYLRDMTTRLPRRPQAILLISAHWETTGFALTGAERPDLIYDYYGFPPETYEIAYPVPGAPWLAQRTADLLRAAGLEATIDPDRGLDHGVFIPMKVAFPEADIPLVEMSLDASLDPALHIQAGEAIAALREENVLVIGSGMSFHNLRAYGDPRALEPSTLFDRWLTQAALAPADARAERLIHWKDAPYARASHPRAEHLLPLMVAAGASSSPGRQDFGAVVMESAISGFSFA